VSIRFPAFATGFADQSSVAAEHGVVTDIADDGAALSRGLYGTRHYRVNIVWTLMDRAERLQLIGFLERYALEEFEFALDGETYTGRLVGDPQTRWIAGSYTQISAEFRARKTTSALGAVVAAYADSVWYDPSDLASLWEDTAGTKRAFVGSKIARIDDKGGLGLHATQATLANRPVLSQDSTGAYCLLFADGQSLAIPTGMPNPTTGAAVFVAWAHTSYPQSPGTLYRQRGDTSDANHRHPKITVSNNDSVIVQFGNQVIQSLATSAPANVRRLLSATVEADNVQIRTHLDGVLYGAASSTGFGDALDSPTGQIGGGFAGRIYSIIHVQSAVSDADRAVIEAHAGV